MKQQFPLIIKLGEKFIPKPDLILCLGTDPKTIFERKPETSLEEVEKQINLLNQFCDNNKNAVWINTGSTIENSIYLSIEAIMKMMNCKFKHID